MDLQDDGESTQAATDEAARRQALVERQDAYKQRQQTEASWMAKSKIRSAAALPFWIAGASLFNTIGSLAGWGIEFPVGLLSPLFLVGFWAAAFGEGSTAAQVAAVVSTAVLAAPFVVFGVYGRQRRYWAFVAAVVLYALDTLLLLVIPLAAWLVLHGAFLVWMIMATIEIRSEAKIAAQAQAFPMLGSRAIEQAHRADGASAVSCKERMIARS